MLQYRCSLPSLKRRSGRKCGATARSARLGEILEELYEAIFDTNVYGVLFTEQKALPHLPDGASIILNALISASKGLASNIQISHPREITPLILEAARPGRARLARPVVKTACKPERAQATSKRTMKRLDSSRSKTR